MLPAPDATGHFIQIRSDLRLHVVTTGPHDGVPVILLHGFPEFWWTWRHLLKFLDQYGFRAIAPDLRGYNFSDKPPGGYDPETMADDIVRLMDAMGYQSATIIGHDFGGTIAYAMALCFPDRVKDLITINSLHPAKWPNSHSSGKAVMHVLSMMAGVFDRAAPFVLNTINHAVGIGQLMMWTASNREALRDDIRYAYSTAYDRGSETASKYVRDTTVWLRDRLPENRNILKRVLVLWSENDITAPRRLLKNIEKSIPNVRVVTIPGCGHLPQEEHPHVLNREVLCFLKPDEDACNGEM